MGMPTVCECEDKSDVKIPQINSESECCKVIIKEINNSTTLETNKILLIKDVTFQVIHYVLPSALNYNLANSFRALISYTLPPTDIPILTSALLI